MTCLRIEIKKSYHPNLYNMRIGDLSGSSESDNFTKEEILKEISDEMKELKK